MNRLALTSLALLLAAASAGCFACKAPDLSGGGMDMFTPVKMRVHPLSRVIPEITGATPTPPIIEGRLEFTDQFGDVCKAAGPVYCEAFKYDSLTPNHHGDRLGLWNFDLSKPRENKQHWDAITRTYLFKLPLLPASLKKQTRLILAATFTLPSGRRLTDDITLTLK
jgi:hypothetical protein